MQFLCKYSKDPDSCWGVEVVNLPGCFSAGDTYEEASYNVREAIDLHLSTMYAENMEAPLPFTEEQFEDAKKAAEISLVVTETLYDILNAEPDYVNIANALAMLGTNNIGEYNVGTQYAHPCGEGFSEFFSGTRCIQNVMHVVSKHIPLEELSEVERLLFKYEEAHLGFRLTVKYQRKSNVR